MPSVSRKSVNDQATRINKAKKRKASKTGVLDWISQRKGLVVVAVFVLIGTITLLRSMAAPAMWLPTADKPLRLHWVLGGGEGFDINNPVHMGLRDLNNNPLPEPDVYDLDAFDTKKSVVDYLHSKNKKVICYFDAGVWEDWRPDKDRFPKSVIGSKDEGWDGSFWLDIRQIDILEPIMRDRIQICKDKGFDSIEPDEITNWSNKPGFPITYQDQVKYNKAVARWAHEAGLSIGLKGDLEQAHDLVDDFDWTLNEECYMYDECNSIENSGGPGADGKTYEGLQLFVNKNKAVWIAEYPEEYPAKVRNGKVLTTQKMNEICEDSAKNRYNTAFYKLGLPINSGYTPCPPFTPRGNTNQFPVVNISSSSKSVVYPGTFTVNVYASDADGSVAKLEIYENSKLAKTCSKTTSCSLDASKYSTGTYGYTAKAFDNSGASAESQTIQVLVTSDTTPPKNELPTVSIRSSAETVTESASIVLTAIASDSDGSISKVEFYSGSLLVGQDTTSPYSLSLSKYKAGSYSFSAKAYDDKNASANSSTINLTVVKDTTSTNPSSPTWPANVTIKAEFYSNFWTNNCGAKSICKVDVSWPSALDNTGVKKYEIWRQELGKDSSAIKMDVNSANDRYYTNSINKDSTYEYSVYAIDGEGNKSAGLKRSIKINCFTLICTL